VLLLFSALAATPAFADEVIWSPNHYRALTVDTSGRRDTISIKSGSKNIRLFYGHFGDALDAWKSGLSKLYGIPESQVGKIVLPSFVAGKWTWRTKSRSILRAASPRPRISIVSTSL
jgi:hypothetical protein